MGIYQRALGDDFQRLGVALQNFHAGSHSSIGTLTVSHATHPIPRFFVWLMRLPKKGQNLETHLEVQQSEQTEVWSRQIGATRLVTKQRLRNGKLVEQAGPLEFEFDLSEAGGAMVFHSYRSRILGIPLPKHIAPYINATATPGEGGWGVLVNIECPRFGVICRYEGEVKTV